DPRSEIDRVVRSISTTVNGVAGNRNRLGDMPPKLVRPIQAGGPSVSGGHHPEWVIDPDTPSVARMYDYYLGGKDNFAADRKAADQVVAAMPNVLELTRANRRLLSRAVTMVAN